MNMIRKGQVRWLAKGDIVGQMSFIQSLASLLDPDRVYDFVRSDAAICNTSVRRNSCGPHVMVTGILTLFVDPFIKARLHKDVGNTVKKAQELPNAWYVQQTFFELILPR